MGNHQLVGIKEWLNMLPDFRKDWGIGNVFFMNAMDLNVAPEKRRLWIDQGVELINDLILPNDDQRKRAGRLAFATGSFKVHRNKVHVNFLL